MMKRKVVPAWAGVDGVGKLRVLSADQLAVDDNGNIGKMQFSPSVAMGEAWFHRIKPFFGPNSGSPATSTSSPWFRVTPILETTLQ